MHTAPTLPSALYAELDGNYSVALYGARGVLTNMPFTLLWPALLPRATLASLSPLCAAPMDMEHEAVPYIYPPYNFLMHSSLWVHRPTDQVGGPFDDHAWVEATHCAYSLENTNAQTPMWFLAVVGSGMRINVGRSVRAPVLRAPESAKTCYGRPHNLCPSTPHYDAHMAHYDLVAGNLAAAARGLGVADLSEYDSVQFPRYNVASWHGEQFTEVIMLNWHSESDFVAQHVGRPDMRCGPPDALRPCTADEPAIAQQGEACRRPMAGAALTVAQQAGCRWYR